MAAWFAKLWGRLATTPPWTILMLGGAVFVLYAYPGLTTKDSFDHLRQAREGFYLDDHPPIMAAIWSVTDRIVIGPPGMLILQGATFLIGANAILRRVLRPRAAALWACALLMFPPVLAPMAVIWKDCLMASALLLGLAGLLSEHRLARVVGLVALSLATALRYNAPAATFLPLLVLVPRWFPAATRWRQHLGRLALATGIWLAVTLGAFGTNAMLADRQMHLWHSSLAVMDIVGTLHFSASDSTDSSLRRAFAGTNLRIDHDIHAKIRTAYVPAELLHLVHGETRLFDLPLVNAREPAPPATLDAVERAWRTIVFGRPGAYLRYRLDTLRVVLGFDGPAWARPIIVTHTYQDKVALEEHGIPTGASKLQLLVDDVLVWASHTPLFKPYVYLLFALVLLVLARRQRDVVAILLSGLGLEASLVLLAHSPDYRYSHWMICCTVLAAIVAIARRRAPHPL